MLKIYRMISKAVIRISATGKGSHGYTSIQKKLIAPISGFNKRSLSIILFITVVFTAPSYAQGSGDTLSINSLNDVIGVAIQHNPTQAVYKEQIRQAEYNFNASKGFLYPNASAAFSGTDNLHLPVTAVPGELIGQPDRTLYVQFGRKYVYSTGLSLSQSIFDWTSVMQAKIAKSNIALNELQQDAYVQSLREQVARLYFSALIAQAALKINQSDRLLADTLQQLSAQRLQEGTSDRISANQAVINASNIQQNQAQSQQLYDQSIENLKTLIGANPHSEINLVESLNLTTITDGALAEMGIDKTLAVYAEQVSIATIQSRAQKTAAYPVISASAFLGDQQFQNDFALSFANNAWSGNRYVGLNISVPLFTGLSNTYKYKSARVQKNIAQIQYDNARDQSAINDRLLLKNHADYMQMIQAAQISFKLYGDNLLLSQQKYREGVISMDIYLKAFQDYLAAENTYLNDLSLLLSTRATILSRQ